MQESQAKQIISKSQRAQTTTFTEKRKYKCFNNQDIHITGVLHMITNSVSCETQNCKMLLRSHLPQNRMEKDILNKHFNTLNKCFENQLDSLQSNW